MIILDYQKKMKKRLKKGDEEVLDLLRRPEKQSILIGGGIMV